MPRDGEAIDALGHTHAAGTHMNRIQAYGAAAQTRIIEPSFTHELHV